ncbi:MAG: hypothetical protein LBW85_00570 [Deltaproteobacteria bacterium]|jgi:ribosomal protein S27E|nr:hypothetical protein [Deltaproteobacteria bacterium]
MTMPCPKCGSHNTILTPRGSMTRLLPKPLRRVLGKMVIRPGRLMMGPHVLECQDCGLSTVIHFN